MKKTIVVASKNKHKIKEKREILHEIDITIMSIDEIDIENELKKEGQTFSENAYIKASEIMKATGQTALADDSGLVVEALGGRPGVYSARFAGENASDKDNNQKLLELMKDVPEHQRNAKFVCSAVMVFPDGTSYTSVGECEGRILFEEHGSFGFGYDPLFFVQQYQKTFAELTSDEKNSISHRAKALHKIKEILINA